MKYPTEPTEFDLCIMRAKSKQADIHLQESNPSINSLMVWHCGKFDVNCLSRFTNLRSLRVAGWYGTSLDVLHSLPNLRHLFIYMLPNVDRLDPLSELRELRHIELAINLWAEMQCVKSLAPIGKLQHLHHLRLTGITAADGNLTDLLSASKLTELELADVFPLEQLAKATLKRPDLAKYFQPIVHDGMRCTKCKTRMVSLRGLSGTRRKRNLCPKCNHKRVAEHQAEFDALIS